MRKVFSVALMAAMVCLVGMTKDAGATVTFNLVWVSTTGTGVTGTNAIDASIGDELIMEVRMTADQTLSAWGISLNFDSDLGNELNLVGGANWTGSTFGTTAMVTNFGAIGPAGANAVESTGAVGGFFDTFNSGQLSGTLFLPTGTYTIGTIKFIANGALNPQPDGFDVFSGLFNVGVDGIGTNVFGNLPESLMVFNNASVNSELIPEPGTASLLGLGLVGLVLAGRRSRR